MISLCIQDVCFVLVIVRHVAAAETKVGFLTPHTMSNTPTASFHVSAPGKVLITGGYLVLIPPSTGLVLSTTARFHTTVSIFPKKPNVNETSPSPFMTLNVKSPQFKTSFPYELHLNSETQDIELKPLNGNGSTFINLAVLYAQLPWWKHEKELHGCHLEITIEADNDYYSQSDETALTLQERSNLPKCKVPDVWPIQKTGLGSSAGLVTSLITGIRCALMAQLGKDPKKELDLERDIHRLAQFVHALAQGKVGSGFDVSSAVYGSQKYGRFPVEALQGVMENISSSHLTCTQQLKQQLEEMQHNDTKWNYVRKPFALPHGFDLFVADVKGGSETPGMVRGVLKWKKEYPNANELWNRIDALNQQVEDCFAQIDELHSKDAKAYGETLHFLSQHPFTEWESLELPSPNNTVSQKLMQQMTHLRETFSRIRHSMKTMGQQSHVEIEPDSQSQLSDASMNTAGCLMAGVPGAGGYDAIFAILFGNNDIGSTETASSTMVQTPRKAIEETWRRQSESLGRVISPLLLDESKRVGLVIEDIASSSSESVKNQ